MRTKSEIRENVDSSKSITVVTSPLQSVGCSPHSQRLLRSPRSINSPMSGAASSSINGAKSSLILNYSTPLPPLSSTTNNRMSTGTLASGPEGQKIIKIPTSPTFIRTCLSRVAKSPKIFDNDYVEGISSGVNRDEKDITILPSVKVYFLY